MLSLLNKSHTHKWANHIEKKMNWLVSPWGALRRSCSGSCFPHPNPGKWSLEDRKEPRVYLSPPADPQIPGLLLTHTPGDSSQGVQHMPKRPQRAEARSHLSTWPLKGNNPRNAVATTNTKPKTIPRVGWSPGTQTSSGGSCAGLQGWASAAPWARLGAEFGCFSSQVPSFAFENVLDFSFISVTPNHSVAAEQLLRKAAKFHYCLFNSWCCYETLTWKALPGWTLSLEVNWQQAHKKQKNSIFRVAAFLNCRMTLLQIWVVKNKNFYCFPKYWVSQVLCRAPETTIFLHLSKYLSFQQNCASLYNIRNPVTFSGICSKNTLTAALTRQVEIWKSALQREC